MSEQEFYTKINRVIQAYQPHEIYYPLKAYGVRYIRPTTKKVTLTCVVVDYMGLPITIALIAEITGMKRTGMGHMLARLGDKNVLNLKGYDKNRLVYEVHSDFKTQLKLDYTAIDNFVQRWNEQHD